VPATDVLFRIAQYTGRPMEWFLVDENAVAPAVASCGGGAEVQVSYAAAPGGGGRT